MLTGIQADDLTGACDTGAPFAARGVETLVLVTGADGADAGDAVAAPVVVLDTESRGLPAGPARERARCALRALAQGRPRVLYKKVDSTLRGAVTAELLGALDGAELTTALLAPAFPAQGRTVVDGELLVDGRPVSETPLARDPVFPRTGASVLAMLADGGARPLGALPLATLRTPGAARARVARFAAAGGRVLVADAESDTDLGLLAGAAEGAGVLLAGSAGLATALAARLAPGRPRSTAPPRVPGRVLVVAGSPHPATRAQVARIEGRPGVEVLVPPAADAAADPLQRREAARALAARARAAIERHRPRLLVLSGGDTAIAVLEAVGARGLRLRGELEPGLALATLHGGPLDGLLAVTKAGAFGDADALVRAWTRCA
jgi:uncharacterized protein YgbK (DUF1537 family)